MSDDRPLPPDHAVAVSPDDASSDRHQSDADHSTAETERRADRLAADDRNAAAVAAQVRAHTERAEESRLSAERETVSTLRHEALLSAVERQSASNDRLALAMVEYQERAKLAADREEKAQARHRWVQLFLSGLLVLVLLGFGAVFSIQYIANRASQDTRNRIVSCVDVNGKCYQDGLKKQAAIIGQVVSGNIYAAACAQHYSHLPLVKLIEATRDCVTALLGTDATHPKPSARSSGPRSTPGALEPAPSPAGPSPAATVTAQAGPQPTRVVTSTATVTPTPTKGTSPPPSSGGLCLPISVPSIPLLPVPLLPSLGLC